MLLTFGLALNCSPPLILTCSTLYASPLTGQQLSWHPPHAKVSKVPSDQKYSGFENQKVRELVSSILSSSHTPPELPTSNTEKENRGRGGIWFPVKASMNVNLIGCILFSSTKKSTAPIELIEILQLAWLAAEPGEQFVSIPLGKADSSFKWKGRPL